ncbi:hypothetical protein E4U42_000067 [Claviceps africana]|uniref:Uncharacterized protein n=1 Tax=Claviceps africana TaxID=83212 RepID=A0A8K0J240_9HYPO|nr:hypothetical protein E4U42_000067 [Claviceps africana]
MTIKNTADPDAVTTETMADRLRYVQSETWRRMRYTDENDEAAWDVYNESLFLQPRAAAAPEDKDKGKGKDDDDDHDQDLPAQVPRLAARWRDKQMLEAISGIVKPDPEPALKPEPDEPGKPARARPAGRAPRARNPASITID